MVESERIVIATQDEDYERILRYENDLVDVTTSDLSSFIDCSSSEIIKLSEVFDELIVVTKSRELFHALKSAIAKYPKEDQKYRLSEFLATAEVFLKD